MQIAPFKLEQYFAKHEFTAKYMLSSSDCDGYPMKYILEQASEEELKLWENITLGYTEGLGSPFLREAICRFYAKAKPENVLVASPGELSFILMNVLMSRKSDDWNNDAGKVGQTGSGKPHAVVISPAYQSLYEVLKSLDCSISYWKPQQNGLPCTSGLSVEKSLSDKLQANEPQPSRIQPNGVPTESISPEICMGWHYNVDELRSLVCKDTRLIIINFPHNPTGAYLTRKQLDEIVEIARSCGAYLYSDEMYRELVVDDRYEALPPVSDLYEKGISLWGTAKSFGMAGLRTGWFVSQDRELLKKIHSFKDYLSICSSAPSEVLTTIALNHSEKFIGPNIEKIKENADYFKKAVEAGRLPFVTEFIAPVAGSVAFVKIDPKKAAYLLNFEPQTALEFSDAIVEKYGIMTIPASMFESDGEYLRIGFGRENFKEVLGKLFRE